MVNARNQNAFDLTDTKCRRLIRKVEILRPILLLLSCLISDLSFADINYTYWWAPLEIDENGLTNVGANVDPIHNGQTVNFVIRETDESIYDGVNCIGPIVQQLSATADFSASDNGYYAVAQWANVPYQYENDGIAEYCAVAQINGQFYTATGTLLEVSQLPDIEPINLFNTSGNPEPGDQITVDVQFTNATSVQAGASIATFFLSTNNTLGSGDRLLGTLPVSAINANSQQFATGHSLTIPSDVTAGSYYVLVEADSADAVNESNENNNLASTVVNVATAQLPDIEPINLFNTSGNPAPGDQITVDVQFTNATSVQAGASIATFFLSTNNTLGSGDRLLGTRQVSTINANSEQVVTGHSLTIPSDVTAGSYYVLVEADSADAVNESNENNNLASTVVNVATAQLPDIEPINLFNTSGNPAPGDQITVDVQFTNATSVQAGASTATFFLSTNNALGSGDQVLGTLPVSAINANSQQSVTGHSLTIPSDVTAGSYYVLVEADSADAVNESNENNNLASTVVNVATAQLPDIEPINLFNTSGNPEPGDQITVDVQFTNATSVQAGASIATFFLSTNNTLGSGDRLLGTLPVSAINANSQQSVTGHSLTIPSDVTAGSYYVLVEADSADAVNESNENNNLASTVVNVATAQLPDIEPINLSNTSGNPAPGDQITVDVQFTNATSVQAGASTATFFLSTNNTLGSGDQVLGTLPVSAINANSQQSVTGHSLTIPSDVTAGSYFVLVEADYGNVINESDETNNIALTLISIASNNVEPPSAGDNNNPPENDVTQLDSEATNGCQIGGCDTSLAVEDPVNIATGNYYYAKTLITAPAIGEDLSVSVVYDTLLSDNDSSLGYGWRHNWDIYLIEISDSRVAYVKGNGDTEYFEKETDTFDYRPVLGGRGDTITTDESGWYLLNTEEGEVISFSPMTGDADGPKKQLTSWRNREGRTLNFTYITSGGTYGLAAIRTNWSQQSIHFEYSSGNLWKIIGPDNTTWSFYKDANGDLIRIVDPADYEHTFSYSNHLMTRATDPEDLTFVRNEYDVEGRVINQWDAMGSLSQFEYVDSADEHIRHVTNRKGDIDTYVHDQNYRLIEHRNPAGHTWHYTWDSLNNLTSKTDPNGNVTTYDYYVGTSNLRTITKPFGYTESFTYYSDHTVETHTNELGQVTRFTYDSVGNLISERNHRDETVNYTYDSSTKLLSTKTDKRGNTLRYNHDIYGNLSSITDDRGNRWQWEHDALGRVTKKIDPLGNAVSWDFNSNGWVNSLTDGEGNTINWEYYRNGKIRSVRDQAGYRWYLNYDVNSRLTKILNISSGQETIREYDATDHMIEETLPGGRTTTYAYNASGLLDSSSNALGEKTSYRYDSNGNLVELVDPAGNSVLSEYDRLNRKISMTNGEGVTSLTFYDPLDRITKEMVGNQVVVERIYNDENNTVSEKDGAGNSTILKYNAEDKLQEKTDQQQHTTQFEYDHHNRLLQTVDPLNGISVNNYDSAGRLAATVDSINGMTSYVRDSAGRVLELRDPLGNVNQYTYTPRGLLGGMTNARGQQISFTYRSDGQVATETQGGKVTSYTYNATNDLVEKTSGAERIGYEHDAIGRLIARTDANGRTLGWRYNTAGEIDRITYSTGETVSYRYDQAGRLIQVTDNDTSMTTRYSYDNRGLLSSIVKPDGTLTAYEYDTAQRLTGLGVTNGSDMLAQYSYTLNSRGKRTAASIVQPLMPVLPTENLAFEYNIASQQIGMNGNPQEFDADGNQITGMLGHQQASFIYDETNRLTEVRQLDRQNNIVGNQEYRYDLDSYLVGANRDGIVTDYVVNPNAELSQVLEEWQDGIQTARYVYGLGLISRVNGNGTDYRVYHFDTRGSTIALTDEEGAVTDRYSYGTFGQLIEQSGLTPNPFKYNGRDGVMSESNGLYYMRQRFFNTEAKRFLGKDLLLGNIIEGQTLNRYGYVTGDPVSLIDPLGMSGMKDSSNGHLVLDGVGLIPGVGIVADLANAGWYAVEGDYVNMGFSLGAAVPVVGYFSNAAKGVKHASTLYDKKSIWGHTFTQHGLKGNDVSAYLYSWSRVFKEHVKANGKWIDEYKTADFLTRNWDNALSLAVKTDKGWVADLPLPSSISGVSMTKDGVSVADRVKIVFKNKQGDSLVTAYPYNSINK